jgi:SH3 domain-containing YSC84-like protein 1
MNTEVLTYSRSKAVFGGLTLEGAVVEQDNDSTHAINGKQMMFRNILSGEATTPPGANSTHPPVRMALDHVTMLS